MNDIDIHSCGYYCDRHACIVVQRNELRDKLFAEPTIHGWPLYSGLPQRKWVGLTEQEQSDIAWEKDKSRIWIVTATEAKLREKNG